VRLIAHAVRCKRAKNCVANVVGRRNGVEGERFGGILQSLQVAVECRDPTIIDTQTLPHGIAALHNAVEYRHPGFLSRHEFAVYTHYDVQVARIRHVH